MKRRRQQTQQRMALLPVSAMYTLPAILQPANP
jgi:hypothetical protein